jgi:hypothetical protein
VILDIGLHSQYINETHTTHFVLMMRLLKKYLKQEMNIPIKEVLVKQELSEEATVK